MDRKGKLLPCPGATNPVAYEHLNRCTDPEQRLERLMWRIAPIDGRVVMDVGAGSGFHAVRYAEKAARVFAVEPERRMIEQMQARISEGHLSNIGVVAAWADQISVRDDTIDVALARFAYFFGTEECLPGLREVKRALKPGGHFFIIDSNPDSGVFGRIARQARPRIFHEGYSREHVGFYGKHGFDHHSVSTVLRTPSRGVLEQIMQMDFPDKYAQVLAELDGTELSYSLSVYHYQKDHRAPAPPA